MKKFLKPAMILFIFAFIHPCMLTAADLTFQPNFQLADSIQFIPASSLTIPTLTTSEREKLTTYKGSLPSSTPDYYDLKAYQTSVKNQNPRGSCQAFAFTAALEAAYVRKYGLNSRNKNTDGFNKYSKTFITNDCSLVCVTPECFAGCEEFDLSEEYHIHLAFTTDSTCNPNISHENRFSYWNGDAVECTGSTTLTGEEMSVNEGYALPREKYAPYFGDVNNNLQVYGTKHSFNDLGTIAQQAGIHTVTQNGMIKVDSDFYKENPTALTQQEVDAFEYDTRHIPLEARKHAIYRPTSLLKLSSSDARNTADLERFIADEKEIEIFVNLAKLDCGDTTYYDKTPVARYSDGHPICRYPVTPPDFSQCVAACNGQNSCLSSCKGLWEGYDNNGKRYGAGHAMLIIGYDRVRQLFLLKNSWGGHWSYIWVPYQFIRERANGGFVIEDIRDPSHGPSQEAMWLGKWDMDYDGHKGTLVIRRTRFRDQSCFTGTRMGTFYEPDGTAHMVTGSLLYNTDLIDLYVDFNNPEPPPFNTGGLDVNKAGQKFQLAIFYAPGNQFTYGNFAAGTTNWNDILFGTLLNRQHISIAHNPTDSFSINQWKNRFRLFYNNGNERHLEVLEIGDKGGGTYYPVRCKLNDQVGNYAAIDPEHVQRMFSWGAFPDLFYHTWEKDIISGLGVFGLPTMMTPQTSSEAYSYKPVHQPVLNTKASDAKPFAVSHSVLLDTASMQIGFNAFSSPVDIYLGLYVPMLSSEIFLIGPDLSLHPLSAGIVKWKENWTDPIDEKLYQQIFLKSIPTGKYSCYTLVVPAGKSSPGYLWETSFTNPWNGLLLPDKPAIVIPK